jgi:hypothetical protein
MLPRVFHEYRALISPTTLAVWAKVSAERATNDHRPHYDRCPYHHRAFITSAPAVRSAVPTNSASSRNQRDHSGRSLIDLRERQRL